MRIVSLVPSWTETLVLAGANVVGRTRFCVHPKDQVAVIPRLAGTKDWNWPKILDLKPDLLILDREENPRFMSEQNEIPIHVSHVQELENMPSEMERLAQRTQCSGLTPLLKEWEAVIKKPALESSIAREDFPGLIRWGRKPFGKIERIHYLIWKDPWMAAGRNTFIGSMLKRCGISPLADYAGEKYPKVDFTKDHPESTLLLFSSEPYLFLRKEKELSELPYAHAFVDGESFSWFGNRALRFLQKTLKD